MPSRNVTYTRDRKSGGAIAPRCGIIRATMMTIDEARHLYAGAESAHDFDHVLRVLALAEHIARSEGADLAIVRTAVLLHDIARNAERETGADHAAAAASRARVLLTQSGAASDFVE